LYKGDSKFLELKLGANYRQCSDNHQHNTEECPEKEELGIYFLTDLTLIKTNSGQNVGIFQQTGYCPRNRCISPFYYAIGGSVSHIIFPKKDDQLAIAFASAKINQYEAESNTFNPFRNESVIELTYKIQLHDRVSFQPDFQYILNPAGTEIARNAFVGLFRTEITF
jgi:porin